MRAASFLLFCHHECDPSISIRQDRLPPNGVYASYEFPLASGVHLMVARPDGDGTVGPRPSPTRSFSSPVGWLWNTARR